MRLPHSFIQDLTKSSEAAAAADWDKDKVLQSLSAIVGEEAEYRAHVTWVGPAWGDEDLQVDVYLLTTDCLFNFWRRSSGTETTSCIFLDSLRSLSLVVVSDERSPYVLGLVTDQGETARIYSKDRAALEEFARKLIEARTQAHKVR